MQAYAALKHYQQVNTQSQVGEASPHRLIQMLLEGGLDRIAQAQGAMQRGQITEKGMLIGKAVRIVGGLRDALDKDRGGDLARNYDALYEFVLQRLTLANLKNDVNSLQEAAVILRQLKEGWDGISH